MNLYDSSSENEDEGGRRPRNFKPRVNFAQITNPQQCLGKFRVCAEAIEYVLQHNTERNRALTPQQQLLTALHWLGNGAQYHGVADMHRLHTNPLCKDASKTSVRKLLPSSFRRKSAGQPVKHLPLFLSNLWLLLDFHESLDALTAH
ncbi:hypothetical protein ILUMI_15119 [Ignelater luminosus]|uniref:Uncharacterized protein n=1 Tax=Ignelater luminosus TaxID=2038154 RepID=A0A8K0CP75_IGNLU|nr:hypothetical protein ILUMI_15119 [Ignelater luminosus]